MERKLYDSLDCNISGDLKKLNREGWDEKREGGEE